jgi:prepilin-type N-terminal cleavage/methylation domain-containing protein
MVPARLPDLVDASHGFTIVEVVVVVSILGILSAVSAPVLTTHLRTATLRAGAEEAVAALNAARQLAIRTSATVCVRNDGTRVQYHVGHCGASRWTGIGTDAAGNIDLANNLRVSGTNNLCFNDLGAGTATPAPCAPNGTLTITSPTSGAALSVIMATTGRLRIQ